MKLQYQKMKRISKYNGAYGRRDLVSPFTGGKVRSSVFFGLSYEVGFSVWKDEEYFYILHDYIEDLINETLKETYTVSMSTNYHNRLMYDFLYKR